MLFRSFSIVVIILLNQSLYILNQTQQSVVLRFGKAVGKEAEPGLKMKAPFVDTVEFFDNRLLDLNAEPKEVISSDRKRLIVDAFAKYRIIDALKFYQTVKNERSAQNKLDSIIESSIRQVLGSFPLEDLLKPGKRSVIMDEMKNIVDDKARSFGIAVQDVRIMRADLPEENSAAIYRRMQTEREREAKEFRAEGEEEANNPEKWKRDRGTITIEMAPLELMPVAVNLFLQQVHHRFWNGCSFVINAKIGRAHV